jgi:rhodanese-related sulfurtransferase
MPYEKEWKLMLDCINKDELLQRINGISNFILIDTIGSYDGNKYKIKRATTIPYKEVIDRRNEITSYDEIIVYCKHRDCVASKKVATALKSLNVPNVKIYEGGIDEWTENNLPVEEV